jgi:transcriptional regulator with XRE-family HTH domain
MPATHRKGAQVTNELAKLIAEVKESTGDSYADIADRADMPRSTVHKLATTNLATLPKLDTLERLARGLNVSVEVVTRAAQAATGYSVYEETTPDAKTQILISNISKLDPDQRAAVSALVQRLLRTTT